MYADMFAVYDSLQTGSFMLLSKAGIPLGKSDASGGIWPKNLMLK